MRTAWTSLSDDQLLGQCDVDTYRASGPGGQKRNKTSSAVRLRHGPSGMLVIAEESRSQHENRARALRRLREALYLKIRQPLPANDLTPDSPPVRQVLGDKRRLDFGRKDTRFWPAVGLVLDILSALEARVSDTAVVLGVSTGALIDFLQTVPKVWEQANQLRTQFGQKPLRHT